MTPTDAGINKFQRFGFTSEIGGAHIARTMMLDEIGTLLDYINDPGAEFDRYATAIEEENCLGKRSVQARKLTRRHLVSLYALDPSVTLFKALLYFWRRDQASQPLVALLCAFARDAVLRMSAPFILGLNEGAVISRDDTERFFEVTDSDRFSKATLKSVAQNINGTWTRSGHLAGHVKKTRTRVQPTPGAIAYALLLGYLSGSRGKELFRTDYIKLLDCTVDRAIELAEDASRRGWIVFKRVGDVIEVLFPNLLAAQEREWIREQG
jgi:hypothetical protein